MPLTVTCLTIVLQMAESFKKHITVSANMTESEQTVDISMFNCVQCGKTFKQAGNLRRHNSSVHTGEKPRGQSPEYTLNFSKKDTILNEHPLLTKLPKSYTTIPEA